MPAAGAVAKEPEFQEYLDRARLAAIRPYRVVDSGKTVQEIFAENNASCYDAYGPDFRINPASGKIVVDPAVRYELLLDQLSAIDGMTFMTNRDMMRTRCPPDQIWCNLRHDVDADLRGQLDQAEMEAQRGIKSTYFILHTAPYYGTFVDGVLHRNNSAIHVYRQIQDLGHEIALHTDGLHMFQNLKVNGAEAITAEIEWLRENGIDLVGTTAHNSPAAYGCNNYAIFKGRQVTNTLGSQPRGVIFQGRWAPLQLLDERELGLEYEANDLFWQSHTYVEYAALRGQDSWRCASNMSRHREVSGNSKIVERWVDQDGLVEHLRTIPFKGYFLVLSVHCLYYGLRHNRSSAPTRRLAASTSRINPTVGWTTCAPFELEASYDDRPGRQRFQSINITNDLGFIDRPLSWIPPRPVDLRIVFMGRDNIHGATIGLESHVHSRVQAESWRKFKKTFRCWNVASPMMGLGRSVALLEWMREEVKPNIVVVGIGADEIEVSLPDFWSAITGFHSKHPAGPYFFTSDGQVGVKEASDLAEIHRSRTRPRGRVSLALPDAGLQKQKFTEAVRALKSICAEVVARIEEMGASPLFLVEECGETAGLWSPQSRQDERLRAHATFRSCLPEWLPGADAEVLDPYELFLKQAEKEPAHWDDGDLWNFKGHRIAADGIMNFLADRGLERFTQAGDAGLAKQDDGSR